MFGSRLAWGRVYSSHRNILHAPALIRVPHTDRKTTSWSQAWHVPRQRFGRHQNVAFRPHKHGAPTFRYMPSRAHPGPSDSAQDAEPRGNGRSPWLANPKTVVRSRAGATVSARCVRAV